MALCGPVIASFTPIINPYLHQGNNTGGGGGGGWWWRRLESCLVMLLPFHANKQITSLHPLA